MSDDRSVDSGPPDLDGLALPAAEADRVPSATPFTLDAPQKTSSSFPVCIGGADAPMPDTYAAFLEQHIRREDRAAIVYEVRAGRARITKVIIPADYDDTLKADGVKAFVRLAPADLPGLLAELPDPGIVREIALLDERNPTDRWHERARSAVFVAAATTSPYGDIWIYRGCKGDEARTLLKHEWAHIVYQRLASFDGKAPGHFTWKVEAACLAEADGFYLRELARVNESENFATHLGEGILASEAHAFARVVAEAPVRSMVFTAILDRLLWRSSAARDMPYADVYVRRIRYVERTAQAPAAAALLAAANRADDPYRHSRLVSLLAHYGRDEDLAALDRPANFQLGDDPYVGTATIERISRAARIDTLNISGARCVDPKALALLAPSGIQRLVIAGSNLGDDAAGPISRLRTLKWLVANDTRLGDEAIVRLGALNGLAELHIERSRISSAGKLRLQRLLPTTKIHFGPD